MQGRIQGGSPPRPVNSGRSQVCLFHHGCNLVFFIPQDSGVFNLFLDFRQRNL